MDSHDGTHHGPTSEGGSQTIRALRLAHPTREERDEALGRLPMGDALRRQLQDLSLSPGFVAFGDQLLIRLNLPRAEPDEELEWARLDIVLLEGLVVTVEPASEELDRAWSGITFDRVPRDRLISALIHGVVDSFSSTLDEITREFRALQELGLVSATGSGGPVENVRHQLRDLMRGGRQQQSVLGLLSTDERLALEDATSAELRATHDKLSNLLAEAQALWDQLEQTIEDAHHREAEIGIESPEIIDVATSLGQRRLHRVTLAHAITALIGGLAVSFGAVAMGWTGGPFIAAWGYDRAHVLASVAFPIGFLILIIGKGELFTENFFVPVTGVVSGRGKIADLMLLWASTLFFNAVGAIIFAWLASRPHVMADSARDFAIKLAQDKVEMQFWTAFVKAIFAGWLMTLLTWLILATRGSGARMFVIWCIGFLIVAGHFNHVVISMSEIFMGIGLGAPITVGQWFKDNFLPALCGNLVGGLVFVTLLAYVQAASLKHGEKRLKESARKE